VRGSVAAPIRKKKKKKSPGERAKIRELCGDFCGSLKARHSEASGPKGSALSLIVLEEPHEKAEEGEASRGVYSST